MRRILLLIPLAALIVSACSDSPNSNGFQILPPGDLVTVTTLDSRAAHSTMRTGSFFADEANISSSLLSIGKAEGMSAYAYLAFVTLPDSIGGAGTIRSATLKLNPTGYYVGDKSAPLAFNVLQLRSSVTATSFKAATIDSLNLDNNPKGSFRGTLIDTVAITVALDSSMIRGWLVAAANKKSADIYGMLLAPAADAVNIRAFYSNESLLAKYPTLTIVCERNGKLDTLSASGLIDTYAVKGAVLDTAKCTVLGGVSHRGFLWFDVSRIPPNVVVNNVVLQMWLNRAESRLTYRASDSLICNQIEEPATHGLSLYGSIGTRTDSIFTFSGFSIIRAVQTWVNRPWLNYGLSIRGYYEMSDLDRYIFYPATADSTRRPRLLVSYTTQR